MPDDVVSIGFESGPSALGVKVPLIPKACLDYGWRGASRHDGVLHRIPTASDLRSHPVGVEDGRDTGRSIAPVEPRRGELVQPERVGEVDQVLGNGGLLGQSLNRGQLICR